jgi:hypothetical protein
LARFRRRIDLAVILVQGAVTYAAMSDDDNKLAPESEYGIRHGLTFSTDDTSILAGDVMNRGKNQFDAIKQEISHLRKLGQGVCQLSDSAREGLPVIPLLLTCPVDLYNNLAYNSNQEEDNIPEVINDDIDDDIDTPVQYDLI